MRFLFKVLGALCETVCAMNGTDGAHPSEFTQRKEKRVSSANSHIFALAAQKMDCSVKWVSVRRCPSQFARNAHPCIQGRSARRR